MAGDWIKVESVMPDKPEVGRLAEILNLDHDAVVGKLVRFWIWADSQLRSGNALSVTPALLDRITYCNGFVSALVQVGWLTCENGVYSVPNFDRHNGQTAKDRALTKNRVQRSRNAASVTESLPEKRREEKSIPSPSPLPPSSAPPSPASDTERNGDGGGFRDASWTAITKRLVSLGVADVRDVVAVLKENYIEPAVVQATINHYVEKNQWEVGALVWRLKKATPEQGPSDGWPKPQVDKQARARAIASREESRTHQQIDSVRRKLIREHGIKEACDFTDRQIVEKAVELGLT